MIFDLIRKHGILFDPFVQMVIVSTIIPPFWIYYTENNDNNKNPENSSLINLLIEHFTNLYLLLTFAIMFAVYYFTRVQGKNECVQNLSTFDSFRARWYLINFYFHFMIDGLNNFKVSRLFTFVTSKVDKRYGMKLYEKDGAGIHALCFYELFVMAPLCLLTYHCLHRGKKVTPALEIIVGVLQATGTILWIVEEPLINYSNFDYDWNLTFSTEKLLYFWFGAVYSCIVWICVPIFFICNASRVVSGEAEFPAARSPSAARAESVSVAAVVSKSVKKKRK